MHTFTGSAICPRCSKAVYAAEQAMGPGRKIYHKPCLTCTSCRTRLDSFKLVEHDQEPYCKQCHIKNFGTVDLRHANLPTTNQVSPLASIISKKSMPQDTFTAPAEIDDEIDSTSSLTGTRAASTRSTSPIMIAGEYFRSTSPVRANAPWKRATSPVRSLPGAAKLFRRSLDAIAPTPAATVTPPALSAASTGSKHSPSKWRPFKGSGDGNICPACQKVVYFAEQVKASGRTWHKHCLRCTECKTPLNSYRLAEKDGVVVCSNCYSKLYGPQGSGYALYRRAG